MIKILIATAIIAVVVVSAFGLIVQPFNVYAARAQFVFHTSDIPIYGESARIKVTDETNGIFVIYRIFLLPGGLGNEVTRYASGDFMSGDSVTACKTDFNTNEKQCNTQTLDEVTTADFFFNG
jgi:hypothetical protein